MKAGKKIFAALLAAMLVAAAGAGVVSAKNGPALIALTQEQIDQMPETVLDLSQGKVTITEGGRYRITGTGTQGIEVQCTDTVVLVLDNAAVNSREAALKVGKNARVTLALSGSSTLTSSEAEGVLVEEGANLMIQDDGELKVTGKTCGFYMKGSVCCTDGTVWASASTPEGHGIILDGATWDTGMRRANGNGGYFFGNAVVYFSDIEFLEGTSGSVGYLNGIVFDGNSGLVFGEPHIEAGETFSVPEGMTLNFKGTGLVVDVGGKIEAGEGYGEIRDLDRITNLNYPDHWQWDGMGWKYIQGDETYITGNWLVEGEKRYYFSETGYLLTGWQKIGNAWYYLNADGTMLEGWQKIDGSWYYFNGGCMYDVGWHTDHPAYDWETPPTDWYYLGKDGKMTTGFANIDGKYYYFNEDGLMQYRWQTINNRWYYFGSDGAMVTGWQEIGGKWYYFDSMGRMYAGQMTPDGYETGEDGAWTGELTSYQAIDALKKSIRNEGRSIVFTLPAGYDQPENWNIQIHGRAAMGDGAMSIHFLEQENADRSWQAGKKYAIPLDEAQLLELTMEVSIDGPIYLHETVDLGDFLPVINLLS